MTIIKPKTGEKKMKKKIKIIIGTIILFLTILVVQTKGQNIKIKIKNPSIHYQTTLKKFEYKGGVKIMNCGKDQEKIKIKLERPYQILQGYTVYKEIEINLNPQETKNIDLGLEKLGRILTPDYGIEKKIIIKMNLNIIENSIEIPVNLYNHGCSQYEEGKSYPLSNNEFLKIEIKIKQLIGFDPKIPGDLVRGKIVITIKARNDLSFSVCGDRDEIKIKPVQGGDSIVINKNTISKDLKGLKMTGHLDFEASY